MTGNGIAQISVYLVVLTLLAYPLAWYMTRVYAGTLRMPRWLTAPERGFYRLVGTKADEEWGWKPYAARRADLHVRLRDPAVRPAAPCRAACR